MLGKVEYLHQPPMSEKSDTNAINTSKGPLTVPVDDDKLLVNLGNDSIF